MIQNKKEELKSDSEKAEFEEIKKKLNSFRSQTNLGKSLLNISKKGLENGVGILNADEIMDELGRTRYE